MKVRILHFILVFFIGLQTLNAQTYYEHYQDGLVIFQLKTDQKKILSNNNIVDFKKEPLFTDYLKDFDIVEVQHLHPDIDDELLNRTYQIRLSDITLVDNLVRELNKNETIAYAELKELHRSFFTPNDPYYASNQWALPKIQAPDAWDISLGSSSVVVAVTDDAFELTHSDLQGVLLPGHDAGGGSSPSPCGSNSGDHGTHVAGIVGAKTNNGIGVASIGAGVSILPVKIGDCSSGALPYGYQGVVWVANNGADVINMSWGGPSGGSYGQNVINNAWNQGVVLVAAAGNDGTTSQLYPAAYNNVIAVASTQSNDTKSSFSQYGTWIDVAAPGSQIASTVPGNSYQNMSGTSMASPMVAGLLGLMKSYAPSASKTDLVDCLLNTADAMPGSSHYNNNQLGSGRINAYKALSCLMSFQNDYDAAISEIISPVGSNCSSQITPQIELRNFGAQTLTSATITYNWGAAPQTYNWTGNLPTGQSVSVTLPTHTLTSGNYTFTATVSNPNGQTDQNSANNTSTSNFSIVANGETVTLTLNTDCWGEETTWEIKDASNNVVYSGGPYQNGVNGTQNTHEICLSEGCYTFIISDSYGDGMAGAQYQGCNVNGYYKLVDGTGDLLFEIGSVNFGGSNSHQFCLSQTQIDDDAGITAIIAPQLMVCSPSVTPIVELKNFGANTLTSVDILYSIGKTSQTFSWTGNLASQQTTNVTLPAIVSSAGAQTFSAETNNPNGQTDQNQANDDESRSIFANFTAQQLPFIEDFENNAQGWFISNPDNSITWELAQVGRITPGNVAAKMDFFNYQEVNRRDGFISPKISLQGVSSAEMTFDHAYRRAQQSANDSLIIYVSTDCTASWTRVAGWAEDGSGTLATQTTSTAMFTPANAVDWCFQPISQQTPGASCFTVNLDAFVGNDIFVMIEAYNAGNNGNNLYIDNINITGVETTVPPTPNFCVSNNQICEGGNVSFTDISLGNP